MNYNKKEVEILRELGRQVAEIAALPQQKETISLWKALNSLKPARPMVMIDQLPWHEMNVDDELTLRCEDKACRGIETGLRQTLYRWKHMPADFVVEAKISVDVAASGMDFGLQTDEDCAVSDPQNDVVGHYYHDQLATEADLEKIKMPHIQYDADATAERAARMREIFDGIFTVEVQGIVPAINLWDAITTWRGAEAVLTDLGERPEFLHKLMARLTTAYSAMLDQLESLGILAAQQSWIHCTGAFTDELPAPGFNPLKPRLKDIWTYGLSQIFSSVSPAMHQEFDMDYLNPLYARFGLVYYGCCDPLDRKLHLVKKIPNLRKISMSPWVNVENGARQIGRDFVFSRKPSPALLAVDQWDAQAVEEDLQETVAACARHGCPLELILKDVSTVRYQPQRLWEWARIAQRLVTE